MNRLAVDLFRVLAFGLAILLWVVSVDADTRGASADARWLRLLASLLVVVAIVTQMRPLTAREPGRVAIALLGTVTLAAIAQRTWTSRR